MKFFLVIATVVFIRKVLCESKSNCAMHKYVANINDQLIAVVHKKSPI